MRPMPDNRRGLTLEYAIEKRDRILAELRSLEHYEQTETLAYGYHDPFSIPLARCDTCQGKAQMQKAADAPIRWSMVCLGCGNSIREPRRRPWQAALAWNQVNLSSQNYQRLPLFGLADLKPDEAHERMAGIRHNLELRKSLAGIERTIAHKKGLRPPGKLYQQRLDAYLQWALLALRLIKKRKQEGNGQ